MSIRERIDDALALWKAGRKEGAWLLGIAAAAATSRKLYPHPQHTDHDALTRFIRDVMSSVIAATAVANRTDLGLIFGWEWLEDILYRQFRNGLIHEGTAPVIVQFSEFRDRQQTAGTHRDR